MSDPLQTRPSWNVHERLSLTAGLKTELGTRQADLSEARSVPELVSTRATATPDALAVTDGTRMLSYGELEARASQLARYLRNLGVGPNIVVGLCLPRSVAMVVSSLAILKAGGAYLPLDDTYPVARLTFQLKDAGVPVLVVGKCMTERFLECACRTVTVDLEGRPTDLRASSDCSGPLGIAPKSEDLAYVIYTSGSTGQPKGVEITHGSLENLVRWHQSAFAVVPSDRATQQASLAFDASVWEIWPYLTVGASLHIPDDDTRKTPESFRNWLLKNAITIAFAPTPMAERLMQLKWPSNTTLRVLLTGGDALLHYPPASLPFRVVNNYGPTECTVVATSSTIDPVKRPDEVPPIGCPISNTQLYILDENKRPVRMGVAGELYIGGLGLAKGYRNRPEFTAERFVPNPFSSEPVARLYRTGDLARYLPDGQIAFLGRIDDQVKVRGYRIEPNEIVIALNRHPVLEESIVVSREDSPGEKRLVAYVVSKPGAQLTDRILREFLGMHLPEFMVPAFFVQLERLPLNSNGKVDRGALPAPTEANILRDEAYLSPRTPIEERLVAILADLLKIERVGVNDNFFLLGGNSLLGAQVIARLHDTLGVELSLLSLFNNPTIADLSSEVERLVIGTLDAMTEEEAAKLAESPSRTTSL